VVEEMVAEEIVEEAREVSEVVEFVREEYLRPL